MTFRTTLTAHGRTATGLQVPPEVVAGLDAGRKPPVRVTINGHTYRSTVAAGDELDLTLDLDTEPREIEIPADLAVWLDARTREFFEGLSYSQQRWYVEPIVQAKKPETRERRVARAVQMLQEGMKR